MITLQDVGGGVLTCEIVSAAATTCNSGAQSFTLAPGGNLRILVQNVGGADTSGPLYYAYRAETS